MRKKIEWSWEHLDKGTRRCKVIGGWLLHTHRVISEGKVQLASESLVFVADRDHEWEIAAPFDPSVNSTVKPSVNPDDFASPK